MKPTYFFIQTREPKGDDPGAVEEGYYIIEGGDELVFCDQDGAGLRGENARRKLKAGEDPRRVAASLLRMRVSRKSNNFYRPLRYEDWRI